MQGLRLDYHFLELERGIAVQVILGRDEGWLYLLVQHLIEVQISHRARLLQLL